MLVIKNKLLNIKCFCTETSVGRIDKIISETIFSLGNLVLFKDQNSNKRRYATISSNLVYLVIYTLKVLFSIFPVIIPPTLHQHSSIHKHQNSFSNSVESISFPPYIYLIIKHNSTDTPYSEPLVSISVYPSPFAQKIFL